MPSLKALLLPVLVALGIGVGLRIVDLDADSNFDWAQVRGAGCGPWIAGARRPTHTSLYSAEYSLPFPAPGQPARRTAISLATYPAGALCSSAHTTPPHHATALAQQHSRAHAPCLRSWGPGPALHPTTLACMPPP